MISFVNCWKCDTLSYISKNDIDKRWVQGGKHSGYQYKFICPICNATNDIQMGIEEKQIFIDFNFK